MERPIPLSKETLRMASEARRDQGDHEAEVSFAGEAGLLQAFENCDKHPGHCDFIPINELTSLETISRFPADFQKPEVCAFLYSKSKESVRMVSNCTSMQRPARYPFHKFRGSKMTRVGSGRIWSVYLDKIKSDIPCPFPDCDVSPQPHVVSGYLRVHTATHVVFNDEEAQKTTVEFFYDTPDDRSGVLTARGFKIIQSDELNDYCVLDCVTHEATLCDKLDVFRKEWMSRWYQIKDQVKGEDLAIIISHPHGCSKQFSFGSCVKRDWKEAADGQCWYRYFYTAATCPGCSGAPVYVPGKDGLLSGYAPHSGHEGDGLNRSATWFHW